MKSRARVVTIVVAVIAGASSPLAGHLARQDAAVDVSGKWALSVETARSAGRPSLELEQDGETLSGTYSSRVFGERKVTGTIRGNAITFSFTTSVRGNSVVFTFSGTADASTMKGKVTVGDMGEGTFTGQKQ